MQKFILENLDCTACAKKLENALINMPCVNQATIQFSTNTLYIQTTDIPAIKAKIAEIEPDIIVRGMHENREKETSYTKELFLLFGLLFGFGLCMLFLHYTPLQSAFIMQLDSMFMPYLQTFTQNLAINPTHLLLFIILACIYIVAGIPIFQAVWRNVKNKVFFDEHSLMFLATSAALCIGEIEEAVAVMIFFRIGAFLESLAVKKSKKSLYALLDITPEIAHVQKKDSNTYEDIHPELLQKDAIVLVKVGEKIPADGIIMQGRSHLNTQSLTGESKPLSVKENDSVLAGAINMDSVLTICVTKPYSQSQIAAIKSFVEESSNNKAKSEKLITKFAQVYMPIIFFLALFIALVPPLFLGAWHEWIYRALVVLMVSCPCALVLSVPLGYFGAMGVASRKGILIKGAEHFETLCKLQHIIFDKTGTLTQGNYQIQSITPCNTITKNELLEIAKRAQRFSNHQIARAIMQEENTQGNNAHTCQIEEFQELSGKGVYAKCCGDRILVGNEKLMQHYNIDMTPFYTHTKDVDMQNSIAHVAKNGIYLGFLTFGDTLKDESKKCVEELQKSISSLSIFSGDTKESVAQTAKELGITQYFAELLPTQKAEKLQQMQAQYHAKQEKVAFVGDGINDCIVLKQADVGISIGTKDSQSDLNKESADVILTNPSPMGVVEAIQLAKKIQKITWQNIIFALGTKLLLLMLGIVGIANMWLAVFGDVGVALLALFNALRVVRV